MTKTIQLKTHSTFLLGLMIVCAFIVPASNAQGSDRQVSSINTLEKELHSEDIAVKKRAARELLNIGDDGVAVLVNFALDHYQNGVEDILIASGTSIRRQLLPALADKREDRRFRAVLLAQSLRSRELIPALIAMRHDQSVKVRAEIISTFGMINDRRSIIGLLDLYHTDEDTGIRLTALDAISIFGAGAVEALPELEVIANQEHSGEYSADFPEIAAHGLASIGSQAMPAIRKMIHDKQLPTEVRCRGIRCVGELLMNERRTPNCRYGTLAKELLPDLLIILRGPDTHLQAAAISEIEQLRGNARSAIPCLEELLQRGTTTSEARLSIGICLVNIDKRHTKGIAAVIEGLSSTSSVIRSSTLNRLSTLLKDAEPFTPKLIELLGDDDEWVRRWSIRLIEHIGAPAASALPRLDFIATSDVIPAVRKEAQKAISAIKRAVAEARKSP